MDKIESIYESYGDIVEEFGKDAILQRIRNLITAYKNFSQSMGLEETTVTLNTSVLTHAIMDHYTDLSRLKNFHGITQENIYKVKAYEVSWLLRRKPLQVSGETEELVYINEKFILYYIMGFFSQLVGHDFFNTLQDSNKTAFQGYVNSLYYFLKFRNCNPQALELAFLSFSAGLVASNISVSSAFPSEFKQGSETSGTGVKSE